MVLLRDISQQDFSVVSYMVLSFLEFSKSGKPGLMIGRVALLWVNKKVKESIKIVNICSPHYQVGERRVLFVYSLLAIGWVDICLEFTSNCLSSGRLELIVWLVPSLIGNAVAVSIVGVLLGPVYPIVMNEASRILPRWLLTGSIGWIAGFGQAGSAVLPFLTGALASRVGIKSLQPLLVIPYVQWSCLLMIMFGSDW